MKYGIKVDNRHYEVEVENIDSHPIIVYVDGERFEVWPVEKENKTKPLSHSLVMRENHLNSEDKNILSQPVVDVIKDAKLYAPIPGIILSIAVKATDHVTPGQEMLIIEAMKMKNIIRSKRDGIVTKIHIAPGQFVQHRDLLIEFED